MGMELEISIGIFKKIFKRKLKGENMVINVFVYLK